MEALRSPYIVLASPHKPSVFGGFPKLGVSFLGGPCNKDSSILVPIHVLFFFGGERRGGGPRFRDITISYVREPTWEVTGKFP